MNHFLFSEWLSQSQPPHRYYFLLYYSLFLFSFRYFLLRLCCLLLHSFFFLYFNRFLLYFNFFLLYSSRSLIYFFFVFIIPEDFMEDHYLTEKRKSGSDTMDFDMFESTYKTMVKGPVRLFQVSDVLQFYFRVENFPSICHIKYWI